MEELLNDFIAETREMMETIESEIIAWEANPADRERLDAIFRFIHTVKGNCGFFDFPRLESLSHAAEDALGDAREGRREPDAQLVSAILAIIDCIGIMVNAIEAGKDFPPDIEAGLVEALDANIDADTDADTETENDTDTDTGADAGADADTDTLASSPVQEAPADHGLADVETEPGNPPAPASVSAKSEGSAIARTIRLPVDLLDRVMSGVSDMVLARNDLAHRLRAAGNQPTIDGPFERLTSILNDVRDAITRMRMQRVETLFNVFPRLVRDLSGELDKQVLLDIEGGDVELDREVIELIRDPITHIVRNAIDHGIEHPQERMAAGKTAIGTLRIAARQTGNRISIVIADDGRGLNEERIAQKALESGLITAEQRSQMSQKEVYQLIFEAGLSTAQKVTSISGRGVGMDVVRDNVLRVGGSIEVSSTPGEGAAMQLHLPLTLSIIAGLVVEVGGQRFAIPQNFVEEIVHVSSEGMDFSEVGGVALVSHRGERIPCICLAETLELRNRVAREERPVVFLRLAKGALFALMVDAIHNNGDIVIKPIPPAVLEAGCYSGTALLDDGQPIMLLDMNRIAENCGIAEQGRSRLLRRTDTHNAQAGDAGIPAMIFTGYDAKRKAVRLDLVQRIETIAAERIEFCGAKPRAQVNDKILPLAGLDSEDFEGNRLRVLCLSDGHCELLYGVREIEDTAALSGEFKTINDAPLVEALVLHEGQTIELLDAHALFETFGDAPIIAAKRTCSVPDSQWARTILVPLVRANGFEVLIDGADEADIAIVIDGVDAPAPSPSPDAQPNRIVHLSSTPQAQGEERPGGGSIYRYDRQSILQALNQAESDTIQNKGAA